MLAYWFVLYIYFYYCDEIYWSIFLFFINILIIIILKRSNNECRVELNRRENTNANTNINTIFLIFIYF